MAVVTVRYYAGARAAAGVEKEVIEGVTSVAETLDRILARHAALEPLLPACSFLLDGVSVRDVATTISAGTPAESLDAGAESTAAEASLDILPPFAGG